MDGIAEYMGVVSIVETPFEFSEIAIQMLGTHLVKRTDYRAFEQAPDAFNAVRMNIADYPFFFGVVHGFMTGMPVYAFHSSVYMASASSFMLRLMKP